MLTRDYMNTKNWVGKVLAVVATFLLMTGCGGGGSGGVSAVSYTLPSFASSPVTITGSTGNSVNNVAMDALNAGGDSLNAGGGGVSGVSVSGGTTTVQQPLFDAINIANKLVVDSVTGSQNAVGLTQTVSCLSSGSVTETIDTSNNILLQYSSCDEGVGFVANGSIAATNVSGTGSVSSFNISMTYSYNLTFTYGGSTTVVDVGSFDVNIAGTVGSSMTTAITNGEMGVTSGGYSLVVTNLSENRDCTLFDSSTYICTGYLTVSGSYDAASEYTGYSFHVSVSSGASALVFDRLYGALYPYQGTMTITGATGTSGVSFLSITFTDDEIDTSGGGHLSPDFSFTWDDGNGTTGSGSGYWSGFAYK